MPLKPDMNWEDHSVTNIKGNLTTNFMVLNCTAYSNVKAILCNAGVPGHIFAGKFKQLKNENITQMLGIYIINGIALLLAANHGIDWVFASHDPLTIVPP